MATSLNTRLFTLRWDGVGAQSHYRNSQGLHIGEWVGIHVPHSALAMPPACTLFVATTRLLVLSSLGHGYLCAQGARSRGCGPLCARNQALHQPLRVKILGLRGASSVTVEWHSVKAVTQISKEGRPTQRVKPNLRSVHTVTQPLYHTKTTHAQSWHSIPPTFLATSVATMLFPLPVSQHHLHHRVHWVSRQYNTFVSRYMRHAGYGHGSV